MLLVYVAYDKGKLYLSYSYRLFFSTLYGHYAICFCWKNTLNCLVCANKYEFCMIIGFMSVARQICTRHANVKISYGFS